MNKNPRGPIGQQRELRERVTLLERRLSRRRMDLPVREVTDANDATEPGLYWIGYGGANVPFDDRFALFNRFVDGRIVQEAVVPYHNNQHITETWRRTRSESGVWGSWFREGGPIEISDWDNALEAGSYYGHNVAHSPAPVDGIAGNWWSGYVLTDPLGPRVTQVVHENRTEVASVTYTRYLNPDTGTVYQDWMAQGYDSGVVDLSAYLKTGISGALKGRVVDKSVQIWGADIAVSAPSSGSTTEIISGLPSLFRPEYTHMGNAWRAGYDGSLVIRADGSGGISQRTGTDWNAVSLLNAFYLRG